MTKTAGNPAHDAKPDLRSWAGVVGVVILLTVALLRVVVSFTPDLYWMTDPRLDKLPIVGFGPLAAVVTDWLMVVALLMAVYDCKLNNRRVHSPLLVLWVVGTALAVYHGWRDLESLRIGSHWSAAVAAALAAMHLASDPRFRRILIASLIALIVPLSAQALRQVTVEHAESVADYMEHREERLRERGWEPGSTEARKFEERLKQNEATGRVGLSNVFAALMMSLTVLAAGVVWGIARNEKLKSAAAVAACIVLLGATALVLTYSKGAAVALISTAAALGAMAILPRFNFKWAATGLLIVAAGIGGVLVRGAMGEPSTAAGERSLLFRYHYWQAAAGMVGEHPVAGVGPGRFQDSYLLHKNPKNPEEVADPHNVFVAFITTLGLGGAAWSALLLVLLWKAGMGIEISNSTSQISHLKSQITPIACILVVAMLVFGIEYLATLYVLGPVGLAVLGAVAMFGLMGWGAWAGKIKGGDKKPIRSGRKLAVLLWAIAMVGPMVMLGLLGAWLMGAVGFALAACWLNGRDELDHPATRFALFAAACAMLLHAQIEMSVTNMMTGMVLLTLLGTAAARVSADGRTGYCPGLGVLLTGLIAVVFLFVPCGVVARKAILSERAAMQFKKRSPAMGDTFVSMRSGIAPDLRAVRYEAEYYMETAGPAEALRAIQEARQTGLRQATMLNTEVTIAEEAHRRTRDDAYLRRAAEAAARVLEHDPYNMVAHARAGELALKIGRKDDALSYYRRALELHELAYLDPNKQFSEKELAEIYAKMREAQP